MLEKIGSNKNLKKVGIVLVGGVVAYTFLPIWLTVGAVGGVYAYTQKEKISNFFFK